jgi:hypothetical protein
MVPQATEKLISDSISQMKERLDSLSDDQIIHLQSQNQILVETIRRYRSDSPVRVKVTQNNIEPQATEKLISAPISPIEMLYQSLEGLPDHQKIIHLESLKDNLADAIKLYRSDSPVRVKVTHLEDMIVKAQLLLSFESDKNKSNLEAFICKMKQQVKDCEGEFCNIQEHHDSTLSYLECAFYLAILSKPAFGIQLN